MLVGQLNDGTDGEIYVHKKDVNRATIYGIKGFKGTLIWEDDYQFTIADNYYGVWKNQDGVWFRSLQKLGIMSDKDDITFEERSEFITC